MATGDHGTGQRRIHIHLPADAAGIAFGSDGRLHVVRKTDVSKTMETAKQNDEALEKEILRKQLTIDKPPEIMYERAERVLKITWKSCDAANPHYKVDMVQIESKESKTIYSGPGSACQVEGPKPGRCYSFCVTASCDDIIGEESPASVFEVPPEAPSKPRPPKITTKSKSAMTLSWHAPESNGDPISKYILEWDQGSPLGNFQEVYSGPDTKYKLSTKLEAGCKYQFRLKAANRVGLSECSEVLPFNTGIAAPPKSSPPVADRVGVDFIQLCWGENGSHDNHVTRETSTSYKLEMEDPDTGHGFRTIYQGDGCQWRQEQLLRNHQYKFRLSMVNEKGTGIHSNPINVTTLPDKPGPPGTPRLVGHIKRKEIPLTWDLPLDDGGSTIKLHHLEMATNNDNFISVYEGEESQYLCEGLTPGMTYLFRVRASSEGGMGSWSPIAKFTTTSQAPSEPLNPRVWGKPHQRKIALKWDPPTSDGGAPIIHYTVEYCLVSASGPWAVGGVVPAEAFQSVDTPTQFSSHVDHLVPGHAYHFRINCVNSSGSSPWSDVVMATTAAGVPGPPVDFVSLARSPTTTVINWKSPPTYGSEVDHYVVRYWTAEDNAKEVTSKECFCPLTSLMAAHEYHYKVAAVNSVGLGEWSVGERFTTPPTSPGQVRDVSVVSKLSNEITVTWATPNNNGSPILNYRIETQNGIVDVGGVGTSYRLQGLSADTRYKVRVQAVNAIGVGSFSTHLDVRTLPPPPDPPTLYLLSATPTSLKIGWDKKLKKMASNTYHLEMLKNERYVLVYTGNSVSHKINKLSPNMEYSLRVSATNESGRGSWSLPSTFATPPQPPDTPTGFKITCENSDEVNFSWDSVRCNSSFHYELQQKNLAAGNVYKQVYAGSDNEFTSCGYLHGGCYEGRVRAVCKEPLLYGKFTDPVRFTIPDSEPITSSTETLPNVDVMPESATDQETRDGQTGILTSHRTHFLFILTSLVIVLLAFLLGYWLDF